MRATGFGRVRKAPTARRHARPSSTARHSRKWCCSACSPSGSRISASSGTARPCASPTTTLPTPCSAAPTGKDGRSEMKSTVQWLVCAVVLSNAAAAFAQNARLTLNDKQYFDARGLSLLVFTNQYNGMFFDEKTAGIEIIQHGVRIATGGAVRLSPTPEQWDQIPKLVDRKVDPATQTISCTLRYEAFDFDSRLVVTPDGAGFNVAVYVDKPVPAELEG